MRAIEVAPYAPTLMESTRSIGYSIESAIADVIDNSVAAGASRVDIDFFPIGESYISILDNGCGMSEEELIKAMQYGSRNPLEQRSEYDLGRYGLGMKTASVSEPHLLYSIMDRHEGWAVMICLVGLGQDIYDGEVGINEWFRCGVEDYNEWEMFYSAEIFNQTEDKDVDKEMIQNCDRCHEMEELHLKTSIRSFRADKQSKFVDAILDNSPIEAAKLYAEISIKYPVFITRDYAKAKEWIKGQVRGSQRCGVLACSSAQRLKPEGIYVPTEIDVKNWFLAPSDDLRSSNMMEIVASEFKVQGLEIDWAVVCWDADLRRKVSGNGWDYYSFRGTKWTKRNQIAQQRYLINSYRVLLTRARQGMVIFVPQGVDAEEDETRNSVFYDQIYSYLISCGIKEL